MLLILFKLMPLPLLLLIFPMLLLLIFGLVLPVGGEWPLLSIFNAICDFI